MAVLVAYDGSAPAQKALARAFNDHADEEIILLRVIEAASGSTSAGISLLKELLKEKREEATRELDDAIADLVMSEDIEYRTETAVGDPAREVVAFAEENDVDHIIVGSHGREGLSRVLLGSVAERVVRRAPVTVTVVR